MRVVGHYRACVYCKAPWVLPLPDGWTVTVVGMYGLPSLVTPHESDCPNGFEKVHVPDVE